MKLLNIIAVLLYSLGAVAFGALCMDFFRARRSGGSDIRERDPDDWFSGTMLIISFAWFLDNLLLQFAAHTPGWNGGYLRLVQIVLMFSFPPLIAAAVVLDDGLRRLSKIWKLGVVVFTAASFGIVCWIFMAIFEVIEVNRRIVGPTIGISIGAMFGLVSIFALVAMTFGATKPRQETPRERGARRSALVLFASMLGIVTLIFVSVWAKIPLERGLEVLGSSMPLLFIFTDLYHANRFEFFDLFVKRGVALLLTVGALAAWFALALPLLDIYREQYIGPVLLAVAALPLALALPWMFRKLSGLVDSRWLGRQLTSVEAVKEFLGELQTATGEAGLVDRAEQGLSTLFSAPTRVDLDLRETSDEDFASVQDIPIRSGEQRLGAIRMGRRENQMPYFSEDTKLLVSLADVFSYMLQNVRLQEKKQEQEQRTKELAHQASLSELKALRAQINPHFLFNALNAIAGLIHKDPFRADSTVEQLAEVFRYTLRGSQKEWARLEDEMEFVEAYLEVERARFGERLQVRIEADDSVRSVRIPTMVVQTLVENAVKHGVSSVRGVAHVEVHARRDGDRLIVEVADNGPGFPGLPGADEPDRNRPTAKGASFGLKSIRERFQGYFGKHASLDVDRDEARALTVVRIAMPLDHGLGSEPEGRGGSAGVA